MSKNLELVRGRYYATVREHNRFPTRLTADRALVAGSEYILLLEENQKDDND